MTRLKRTSDFCPEAMYKLFVEKGLKAVADHTKLSKMTWYNKFKSLDLETNSKIIKREKLNGK